MNFCSNCGTRSSGGAFCGGCGSPMGAAAQPARPAQPAQPARPEVSPNGVGTPTDTVATKVPRAERLAAAGSAHDTSEDAADDTLLRDPRPGAGQAPSPSGPRSGYEALYRTETQDPQATTEPQTQQLPQAAPPAPPQPVAQQPTAYLSAYPSGPPAQQVPDWSTGPGHLPPPPTSAPRNPAVNPFLGVPVSDYLRDLAGVVLLLTSLGVAWNVDDRGGDLWWAVLPVLVSLGAVVAPYLAAARVAVGFGAQQSMLLKLALQVPLAAAFLFVLISEIVAAGDDFDGGVGLGVALALAGATFLAQPRRSELTAGGGQGWAVGGRVLAVAAVAVLLLSWAAQLLRAVLGDAGLFDEPLGLAVAVLTVPVVALVLLGGALVGSIGGRSSATRVLATAMLGVLVFALFAQGGDSGEPAILAAEVDRYYSVLGSPLLLGAAAALLLSHPVLDRARDRDGDQHPARVWVATGVLALNLAAATVAVSAVGVVLAMIPDDVSTAAVVVVVLLGVAGALQAVAGTLLRDPRRTRPVALGLMAAAMLVSVIAISVIRSQDVLASGVVVGDSFYPVAIASSVTTYVACAMFVLPLLAAVVITAPRPVRETLGALVSTTPAAAPAAPQPGYGQPGYGDTGYAQPGYGDTGYGQSGFGDSGRPR